MNSNEAPTPLTPLSTNKSNVQPSFNHQWWQMHNQTNYSHESSPWTTGAPSSPTNASSKSTMTTTTAASRKHSNNNNNNDDDSNNQTACYTISTPPQSTYRKSSSTPNYIASQQQHQNVHQAVTPHTPSMHTFQYAHQRQQDTTCDNFHQHDASSFHHLNVFNSYDLPGPAPLPVGLSYSANRPSFNCRSTSAPSITKSLKRASTGSPAKRTRPIVRISGNVASYPITNLNVYLSYLARQKNESDCKSKIVWSEDVEDAFMEAIQKIPKVGRRKVTVKGRPCGRNELISEYILKTTGKLRSRKQVSSHIQVLKHILREDPKFMSYVDCKSSTDDVHSDKTIKEISSIFNSSESIVTTNDNTPADNSVSDVNHRVLSSDQTHYNSQAHSAPSSTHLPDEYLFINTQPRPHSVSDLMEAGIPRSAPAGSTFGNLCSFSDLTRYDVRSCGSQNHIYSEYLQEPYNDNNNDNAHSSLSALITRFPLLQALIDLQDVKIPTIHAQVTLGLPATPIRQQVSASATLVLTEPYGSQLGYWFSVTNIISSQTTALQMVEQCLANYDDMGKLSIRMPFAEDFWSAYLPSLSMTTNQQENIKTHADLALEGMISVQRLYKCQTSDVPADNLYNYREEYATTKGIELHCILVSQFRRAENGIGTIRSSCLLPCFPFSSSNHGDNNLIHLGSDSGLSSIDEHSAGFRLPIVSCRKDSHSSDGLASMAQGLTVADTNSECSVATHSMDDNNSNRFGGVFPMPDMPQQGFEGGDSMNHLAFVDTFPESISSFDATIPPNTVHESFGFPDNERSLDFDVCSRPMSAPVDVTPCRNNHQHHSLGIDWNSPDGFKRRAGHLAEITCHQTTPNQARLDYASSSSNSSPNSPRHEISSSAEAELARQRNRNTTTTIFRESTNDNDNSELGNNNYMFEDTRALQANLGVFIETTFPHRNQRQ